MARMHQPRTAENASTGGKRDDGIVSRGWIIKRLFGALGILLVLLVVVRNLFFPNLFAPAPKPPDVVVDYITSITIWGGRIYTSESEKTTGVFDMYSGKRVATIPEIVVGSDARFLYSYTGERGGGGHIIHSHLLTARDGSGNLVWSYNNKTFALPEVVSFATAAATSSNLQSDRDNIYLLGASSQQYTETYQLVALNKASGVERWHYALPLYSRFVVAQGAVAVLSWEEKPQLIALSPVDGHQLWRQPAGVAGAASASVFTDGQRIFLLTSKGLRTLSAQTGEQLWEYNYQPPTYGAELVFDGGVVYLLDESDAIAAIRASDGHHLWRTTGKTGWSGFLAAQSGVLYALEGKFWFSAVNGSNGQILWSVHDTLYRQPVLLGSSGGLVYINRTCDGPCAMIFAISQQTGKLVWKSKLQVASSVLLQGQSIYIASLRESRPVIRDRFGREVASSACSDTTTLTSLSATTGAVEWRHATTIRC